MRHSRAAETERAALEGPAENVAYCVERQDRVIAASSPRGGSAERGNTAAKLSALSYDDILRDRVAFGTAARLIDRVNEWREVLGIDGITAEMNAGGMLIEEQVKNSLCIITRDVMPAFK